MSAGSSVMFFTPSKSNQQECTPTVKGLAKDFGENTSMHGLGRAMGGNSSLCRKLLWALLVLAAAGMAISNLIVVFKEFLTYPTSTEFSVEYQPKIPFPAVTVCNLNRVRRSRVPSELESRLDYLSSAAARVMEQNQEIDLFLRENSEAVQIALGHDLNEMLIDCFFDTRLCDPGNFTVIFNMALGNCYTFNSGDLSGPVKDTKVVGPRNGLILELNIQQTEYLPITPGAGVKVLVHPPGTMGFPEEAGVQAASGFSTSIGLTRVEIERTPPPYGQCIDAKDADNDPAMNIFAKDYGVSYSDTACKKSCYQVEVFKKCLCCDTGYPCQKALLQYTTTNLTFIPACNTSNIFGRHSSCLLGIQAMYLQGNLPCISDCKPACSEIDYKQTVSSSRWPSDAFGANMLNKINRLATSNNLTLVVSNDSAEVALFVEKNFLRVEVFYEQINSEKIKTTPAYDWYRLLSDIGGQLGLWMGFSLMTGIEIIELVVDFVGLVFKRVFRRKPRTSQSPVTDMTISGKD